MNQYFQDLNLHPTLLKGMQSYQSPTLIQKLAIKHLIEGKNSIINAPHGSGKTYLYVIAALQMINPLNPHVQVVVINHSIELAEIVENIFKEISQFMNISIFSIVGTIKIADAILKCQSNCQIIIATPGKLNNLVKTNCFNYKEIKLLILDDIEELVFYGYKSLLDELIQFFSKQVQIAVFGHNYPEGIFDIFNKSIASPLLLIKAINDHQEMPNSYYHFVTEFNRYQQLLEIITQINEQNILIFCNSYESSIQLLKKLDKDGFLSNIKKILIVTFQNIAQNYLTINYEMKDQIQAYHDILITQNSQQHRVVINLLVETQLFLIPLLEQQYFLQFYQYTHPNSDGLASKY